MAEQSQVVSSVSFFAKKSVKCPLCETVFKREDMLSGGGRMIAGNLTDELRRLYEPSIKYGRIYPLMYTVGACPSCHGAFFWKDFDEVREKASLSAINRKSAERKEAVAAIFPYYDLNRPKTVLDGAAVHYLALLCYEDVVSDHDHSPTAKKALLALRLAWLCGDLHDLCPGRNYDYIRDVFYHKAAFLYGLALEYETTAVEPLSSTLNFGPDIDKNYGYTGLLYLSGLLEYKYGQRENLTTRLQKLDGFKRNIARVFGLGKSNKNKPLPLLEHARNLYDQIREELQEAMKLDLGLDIDPDDDSEE
jgi:uncharacterized protein (DUF2225 family)